MSKLSEACGGVLAPTRGLLIDISIARSEVKGEAPNDRNVAVDSRLLFVGLFFWHQDASVMTSGAVLQNTCVVWVKRQDSVRHSTQRQPLLENGVSPLHREVAPVQHQATHHQHPIKAGHVQQIIVDEVYHGCTCTNICQLPIKMSCQGQDGLTRACPVVVILLVPSLRRQASLSILVNFHFSSFYQYQRWLVQAATVLLRMDMCTHVLAHLMLACYIPGVVGIVEINITITCRSHGMESIVPITN